MRTSMAHALVWSAASLIAWSALAQDEAGIDRYVGRWRLDATTEEGNGAIERAIADAVAPMNFLVRGIAAGRLRERNLLVREITVARPAGRIRIVFDGQRVFETPDNRWAPHTSLTGEQVQVLHRYAAGALEQYFHNETGTRRNTLRLLADGRVRFSVSVESEQLPQAMAYSLVYRPVGGQE